MSTIGRVQLKKLDDFIKKRKEIWDFYQIELNKIRKIRTPPEPLPGATSSYYLYWIKVEDGLRDELAKYLLDNGIYTTFRYYPLHKINLFDTGEHLPVSEKISEETLNLPLHQNLSQEEIEYIVTKIRRKNHHYCI